MAHPEHAPNPADTTTPMVVQIADRLYHGDFARALTEAGETALYQEIGQYADLQTSGIGEVIVKVPLQPESEHRQAPDDILYIGVQYNLVTTDVGIALEATGLLIPSDTSSDLADDPELQDAAIIDLGYDAFRWDESR